MKPHHEYGLLVSFLNVSAVRYGMFGQFIYFYLFFASASPLVCACLFSVLLVCLYLFFLCRPSYSPFFSKNFLSINLISGVNRSMGKGKIVVVFCSDDISRIVWRYPDRCLTAIRA